MLEHDGTVGVLLSVQVNFCACSCCNAQSMGLWPTDPTVCAMFHTFALQHWELRIQPATEIRLFLLSATSVFDTCMKSDGCASTQAAQKGSP
jgi:hypothetical protein